MLVRGEAGVGIEGLGGGGGGEEEVVGGGRGEEAETGSGDQRRGSLVARMMTGTEVRRRCVRKTSSELKANKVLGGIAMRSG